MTTAMPRRMGVAILAGLALALLAPAVSPNRGGEEKPAVRVYLPSDKEAGKKYADYAARWWQWAVAQPADKNPVVDMTGELAGVGQSGPVWFLAGTFGGPPVKRTCTVPAGKELFFPVLNYVASIPLNGKTEKDLRAKLASWKATPAELELTIDGRKVPDLKKHFAESALFTFVGPEKGEIHPAFAGKHEAIAFGYWVLLAPLPPGRHTIHFRGRLNTADPNDLFETEVTYNLTVAAK